MRILFKMDKKDYVPNGGVFRRPSGIVEMRSICIGNTDTRGIF